MEPDSPEYHKISVDYIVPQFAAKVTGQWAQVHLFNVCLTLAAHLALLEKKSGQFLGVIIQGKCLNLFTKQKVTYRIFAPNPRSFIN